jgi:sugar lactone lactonase YvrE
MAMTPDVLARGLSFPEGPAFDAAGRLWGVELKGKALFCLDNGNLTRIHVGGGPNGLAFAADGRGVFCDSRQRAIRCFTQDTAPQTLIDWTGDAPPDEPNDLAFGPGGELVFTTPGNSREVPTGTVWCRTPDGSVRRIAEGLYFPNGLAFTPDGHHLIIAETRRQRLWKGRWDKGMSMWQEPYIWAEVGGVVGPDGMAFAADGYLYVAIYGDGVVRKIDTQGHVIADIAVPAPNPTNCAFDPSGKLGLIVTEASQGLLLSFPEIGAGARLFA